MMKLEFNWGDVYSKTMQENKQFRDCALLCPALVDLRLKYESLNTLKTKPGKLYVKMRFLPHGEKLWLRKILLCLLTLYNTSLFFTLSVLFLFSILLQHYIWNLCKVFFWFIFPISDSELRFTTKQMGKKITQYLFSTIQYNIVTCSYL